MSDTGFQIDAEAFGLPTNVNNDSTPGFMYGDDDIAVDVNDPIYQATVEAMKARGIEIPAPGEEARPPEMPTQGDGETPITTHDGPAQKVDTDALREAFSEDGASGDAGGAAEDAPTGDTPSTPSTPAPTPTEDGAPETPGVVGEGDLGSVEGDPETPGTLTFQVDGQDITLNRDQAEYLLRVNTWLEQLPDETKAQWAGIEQGTHVAISAQEYQQLREAAAGKATPSTPKAPDLDDLDDDTIEYIRSLEARVPREDQSPITQDQAPGYDSTELQAAFQHQAERRAQMQADMESTNESWKSKYGLTDEQFEHLQQVTAQMQVIPNITNRLTQYSATGKVIREAPFSQVLNEAYEIAMTQDPTLRKVRDEFVYNQRVAQDAERNQVTNQKKAKAASVAAAPSAAVPVGGQGPSISPDNRMDMQATSAAIAEALRQMQEQS